MQGVFPATEMKYSDLMIREISKKLQEALVINQLNAQNLVL